MARDTTQVTLMNIWWTPPTIAVRCSIIRRYAEVKRIVKEKNNEAFESLVADPKLSRPWIILGPAGRTT